jgi:gluconolactonase
VYLMTVELGHCGDTVEILCHDLALPEGPVLLPGGAWLVTELALARGCVTRVEPNGDVRRVAHTGRPNGLAVGRDGTIWVAESLHPSVLELNAHGDVRMVSRLADGEALLWPNDICVGPDGALYVTDSGILIGDFVVDDAPRRDHATVRFDGRVVRVDPVTGESTILDRGLRFANGIAFGPDDALYVSETMTGNVYRYHPGEPREFFGNVLAPDWHGEVLRGPDGMAFDRMGRLYVAVFGQGDVTILEHDGSIGGRIRCGGSNPTNIAFGPPGSGYFVVTEGDQGCLERHICEVDGLELQA